MNVVPKELRNIWSATFGFKDTVNRESDFVAKIQFLCYYSLVFFFDEVV